MISWGMQAILGWTLLLAALSLQRMGPAFKRSRFSLPIAALGLALMIFIPETKQYFEGGSGVCQYHYCDNDIRALFLDFMLETVVWMTLAVLGVMLILNSSNLYEKSKPLVSTLGWIIVISSWYVISQMRLIDYLITNPENLIWLLFVVLGVLFTLFFYYFIIRSAERSTPRENKVSPLDERERKLVTEIIRRNLRGE